MVYRTVHEEPDLDGVPGSLLPLVTACLAKDAAARPSASEVRAALGPADGPAGDWLPVGLPALVARRSAEILDLPVADPTVAVAVEPRGRRGAASCCWARRAPCRPGPGVAVWLLSRAPSGSDAGRTAAPCPRTRSVSRPISAALVRRTAAPRSAAPGWPSSSSTAAPTAPSTWR